MATGKISKYECDEHRVAWPACEMSRASDGIGPMIKVASQRKSRPSSVAEPQERPRRARAGSLAPLVLIVDDCEDSRELYAAFFGQAGFRVAAATDGEHAMLKVMALKPNLIITDLAMPVLDGWAAIAELKTRPLTADIPVIALTGRAASADVERALEAGADVVLTKPCAPATVFDVARRLLAQRRM
jgi:two-component system, cell cycle response regulator DivK